MKTDQVQALESGDWSIFAAPVYTRGFVRNYATLLKLDPEALLNDLDVELGQAQPSAAKADGDSPLRAGVIDGLMLHFSGVKWRRLFLFLIVTMAVGGFFAADYWRDYQSRDHLEGLGSGLNDAPVPGRGSTPRHHQRAALSGQGFLIFVGCSLCFAAVPNTAPNLILLPRVWG